MNVDRSFLDGGGAARQMILNRDWSNHPLGPPENWPTDLRVALSLVLNSPESMILAWGPELHFFFNEAYFPLLGPRIAWAMGERFDKVWADGWGQAKPIIDNALAGRTQRFVDLPWKLETDRGAADTWWTFSYSRVLGANGAVAGVFIFTNETTEKVLSDAAVRDRTEQLRLIIESARSHAILTTDVDGTITSWSPGAALTFGWRADEAVGEPFGLIFTPEDRAQNIDHKELEKARRDGVASDERWHFTKAEQRVYMVGSTHPLARDAKNRPIGFLKVARDETERHLATSQMELEVERQRLSLQQMPGFVALLSGPDHIYRYVNDAYVAISGERMFLGRSVRDVFPDLVGQGFHELLDNVFNTGEPFSARAMPIRLAGETSDRFIDLLLQPIRDPSNDAVTGIFVGGYDISERVHAERALELANETLEHRVNKALEAQAKVEEALRQSQKMEAVGQLTGGIAHDFNNLLAAISGSLEAIEKGIAKGRYESVERFAGIARSAVRRGAALTHRLLAFSRRQLLDPKATDVNLLVDEMADLIKRTVGPSVRLEVREAENLWMTLVDRNQLENALLNLCINARDAMPNGGALIVQASNVQLDDRTATSLDLTAGEYVTLNVADSGVGMPQDVIAKAFEPFYTTKPIGQGTGLGLSMAYGFARQSGGQVHIESDVGRGTAVSIFLPRYQGRAPQDAQATNAVFADVEGRGETVVLIEDEPDLRLLLAGVLTEAGYVVVPAEEGPGGLRILDSDLPVSMLITDVGLPGGLNGRQVADAARARRPDLKVLFITGFAEKAAIGHGRLNSGMSVLTKPFDMATFTQRVREMLGD